MNIRLPQPPPPRPPDGRWHFGTLERAALNEACPGGFAPPRLRLAENESRESK